MKNDPVRDFLLSHRQTLDGGDFMRHLLRRLDCCPQPRMRLRLRLASVLPLLSVSAVLLLLIIVPECRTWWKWSGGINFFERDGVQLVFMAMVSGLLTMSGLLMCHIREICDNYGYEN